MKRELTNQELLDRYIHSVKMLLPPDKMDDIAAEIRSNLESLAEDKAERLGRELSPGEMSAILKQHGHPQVVASRYRDRPGQALIGPWLFPFYRSTLRGILSVWVTVRVIGAVLAFHGTATTGSILLNLSRNIMVEGFLIAAGVTAVFAVWEYLELPFPYAERWRPEHLPPVPPPSGPRRIAQQRPIARIMGGVAGLFFFAMALFWPAMFWVWGRAGVFSPSATVYAMRLPLLLLALCWIFQGWLNFTRFAEAEWRPFLRLAVNIAGLVFALVLLWQGDLLIAGPNMTSAQGTALAALNRFFAVVLVVSCISSGLQCVIELRRFIRKTARRLGGDPQTADSAS
jgi:hypothetical protein